MPLSPRPAISPFPLIQLAWLSIATGQPAEIGEHTVLILERVTCIAIPRKPQYGSDRGSVGIADQSAVIV